MSFVHDWLERRAWLSPERVALVDGSRGDAPLTYAAWEESANRTAHLLQRLGVARGERVAVLAHNAVEVLDVAFACAKLGALFQPLNWRLALPELQALVGATRPRLLVYGPDFRTQATTLRTQVATLVTLGPKEEALPGAVPFGEREALPSHRPPVRLALGADAPWMLLPTGGSTGTPKCAVLTHGSILANAVNTAVSWGLGQEDVALLNAPLFHAGGLHVFTTPLVYVGGTSVVVPRFDVEDVLARVGRGQLSVLFGVPTMYQELQRHPRFSEVDWRRLKLVISGGAPCPPPVFERFFEAGVAFRTGYGLTEAGPNTFALPAGRAREKVGCVGWPLFHVEVRLEGAPEEGEAGPAELLVRGPHLFAGYWERPEESARALEGGWLHTGDLATRDAEGCYRVVGRKKELILSGGENVYPAEVESVLAGHPAVAEVAVIGVADAKWGEVPRALVVLRPGARADAEELVAFCFGRMARYKVPRSVRFLEALPRTGAGKVDRRALQGV